MRSLLSLLLALLLVVAPLPAQQAPNMLPAQPAAQPTSALGIPSNATEKNCTASFGVLQYDPRIPGGLAARMSESQAKWFAKYGPKEFPGLCYSLAEARYLVVWSVSTKVRTFITSAPRTAQAQTSTSGTESGSFSTYGALFTSGHYSGTYSSDSSTTIHYTENVPVSISAPHCFIYVIRSVGPTVWDDLRNHIAEPVAAFSSEARGPNRATPSGASAGTTIGLVIGTSLSHAIRREPTTKALKASLNFIAQESAHPERVIPQAVSVDQSEHPTTATVSALVHVTSAPAGGEILVDGKFYGSAPSDIMLPAGQHVVRVALQGKEWSRTVEITGGEISINAELEQLPSGEGPDRTLPELNESLSRLLSLIDTWKSACSDTHISFKECGAQAIAAKPALDRLHTEWQRAKKLLVAESSRPNVRRGCQLAIDKCSVSFDRYLSVQDRLFAVFTSVDPDSPDAQRTWESANAKYQQLLSDEDATLKEFDKALPDVNAYCFR